MQRKALWVITGATLLYLLAFAFNVTPYLRGPQAWRWAYAIPGYPLRHLLPIAFIIVYGTVASYWSDKLLRPQSIHRRISTSANQRSTQHPDRPTTPSPHRFLFFIALAIPLIQAALLFPESPDVLRPLFYRTVSAGASGVFSVGSTIADPVDFLRRYPDLMPAFPVHPQRYPPGLVMLFYGARRLFEVIPALSEPWGLALRMYQCHDFALMRLSNATIATALLQMALPAMMGLIVFPLYGLARRTVGERAALWATMAYPLVPSFALWSARWDQFYPLLTCAAWYCFWRGVGNGRWRKLVCQFRRNDKWRMVNGESRIKHYAWLLLSGLLLSCASFLSFGSLALLAPLGLSALLWILPHPERRQWLCLIVDAVVFFTGLVAPWLIYQAAFGSGFLEIWRVSMAYHLGLGRDYTVWLVYHLYDFLAFLGLPLALLFVGTLGLMGRDGLRDGFKDGRLALPLGFGAGLLLLNLSGAAQGEVARVWLFLTPFAVITAGYGLARLAVKPWCGTLVLSLLALHLLVFNAFLRVVTTGVTDPPMRESTFTLAEQIQPLDAEFGDEIALLGYTVDTQPGDILHLTLYWHARKQMTQPYTVFTHLSGADGVLIAQQDNMPQQDRAPTTCWIPGEIIADAYSLPVLPEHLTDAYTLSTGFYIWETGVRLPARGAAATPDHAVTFSVWRTP